MLKEEARAWARRTRATLSAMDQAALSNQICEHFFTCIALPDVRQLHSYLPIAKQKEPDTLPILSNLHQHRPDITLSVPYMVGTDSDFVSVLYNPYSMVVQNGTFGMTMPAEPTEVLFAQLDMAIIPMLAYDATGARVGYGHGFYDRFLARCRPQMQKIGLSFFGPLAAITDVWGGDMRLDAVVTPAGVHWFGS